MARPLGELLASSAASAATYHQTGQAVWRGSYDVADERAKVGRVFGDGSARQARQVITAIRDTALAWIKKVGTVTDDEGKPYKLRWDLVKTLETVLGFMDFATGECIATYEMIANGANQCRMTTIRHMAILRRLRWVDWVRRSQSGGDGSRQAPNAYFFEISRLPLDAEIHLRQILKRKGVKLESHPDRKGSGPVPNRAQRLAQRIAQGFTATAERISARLRRDALMRDADFVRAEMALFGDIATSEWAAIRHPDDPDAQRAYNDRLGISFFDPQSNRVAPDPGVQNKDERN